MTRKIAAVTGASSGIGSVFASRLAAKGYDLLLTARRRERLDELARALRQSHGIEAETLAADLASEEGIATVADRLAREERLAMLVNNAGFGTKGRFYEASVEDHERMLRVHVDATMRLTYAALGGMQRRNEGAIITVSSVAAFARSPGNVSYCASKAWINAFVEGLHLELRGVRSNVIVQALCPGFTYTEFHDAMGVSRGSVPKWLWMNAEDVVDASLRALKKRKLIVVPGWKYRLFVSMITKMPVGVRVALGAMSPQSRDRVH